MSLTSDTLGALNSHWALKLLGESSLQRADELVNQRLAQSALGQQIQFEFSSDDGDAALLERVALAYELAANEGLEELVRSSSRGDKLREQAIGAAYKAFSIRRLMPIPNSVQDRLFFVLQLSSLAYCGDRWSDLRRWYAENGRAIEEPNIARVDWDQRLLYRLFDCWIRLFRKQGWNDLDHIREIIAGLRSDQQLFEQKWLSANTAEGDRSMALRLVALYHWAKATEVIALYVLQGEPTAPFSEIDKHFDAGVAAAEALGDAQTEMILRWLHVTGRTMIRNSLWWATRAVNSRMTDFVGALARREHQAMFELLPPQRAALAEQGLLDQAKTAIVIDMPTSGGKTLLAQFRILQALNQFDADDGWVAYVAPTKALAAQITRRMRQDFQPIGIQVEQLTAAVEVDEFEESLLSSDGQEFQVLVATPEKLGLVIRNRKVNRPLALLVMDEAHNIELEGRGMRIELLLATVRRDCASANFLLLMPYAEEADSIARWLASDINAGRAISLGTTPWKPNERIIGIYSAVQDDSIRAGWQLMFETLTATEKAMPLHGIHRVGRVKPIAVPKSKVLIKGEQKGAFLQTAAMGTVMSSAVPCQLVAPSRSASYVSLTDSSS